MKKIPLNSQAQLYQPYACILKASINPIAGIATDIGYGFVVPAVFRLVKGLSFGVLVWFFRVVMSAASTWMMFTVPFNMILYNLTVGPGEMLLLGILYGSALKAS